MQFLSFLLGATVGSIRAWKWTPPRLFYWTVMIKISCFCSLSLHRKSAHNSWLIGLFFWMFIQWFPSLKHSTDKLHWNKNKGRIILQSKTLQLIWKTSWRFSTTQEILKYHLLCMYMTIRLLDIYSISAILPLMSRKDEKLMNDSVLVRTSKVRLESMRALTADKL